MPSPARPDSRLSVTSCSLASLLDQRAGAARAGLLVGVEQHGDPRVVLEVEVAQDFQHMDRGDDAALVVGDAGTVHARSPSMRNGRAAAVPLANTVSMCAISRIFPLPVPFRVATMLSPTAGFTAGTISIDAPSFLQFFAGDGADLAKALLIAGAGIDVDQPLQKLERVGLVVLGAIQDLLVRLGRGRPKRSRKPPAQPAANAPSSPASTSRPLARSGKRLGQPVARRRQHAALGDEAGDEPRRRHVEAVVGDRRAFRDRP